MPWETNDSMWDFNMQALEGYRSSLKEIAVGYLSEDIKEALIFPEELQLLSGFGNQAKAKRILEKLRKSGVDEIRVYQGPEISEELRTEGEVLTFHRYFVARYKRGSPVDATLDILYQDMLGILEQAVEDLNIKLRANDLDHVHLYLFDSQTGHLMVIL
jgi:hypothetical protein